jgi:hypothetical protein
MRTSLSPGQEVALCLLPILPTLLSLAGSSAVVHHIVRSRFNSSYKRLLFGMSVVDIVFSITWAASAFLLDRDNTVRNTWVFGTRATCTTVGFLSQVSVANFLYNGMLSLFFLLQVRFNWTPKRIAKCVEPAMHCVSIGYPLCTAVVALVLDTYREMDIGRTCYIDSEELGWLFAGLPVVSMFITIFVSNIVIYFFVRRTILRGKNRVDFSDQSASDTQIRRIRALRRKACWFVASFLMTYGIATAALIIDDRGVVDDADVFWLLVLLAIFNPLNGYFNSIIYFRPRYERARIDHPRQSRLWALLHAINNISPTADTHRIFGSQGGGSGSSMSWLFRSIRRNAIVQFGGRHSFTNREDPTPPSMRVSVTSQYGEDGEHFATDDKILNDQDRDEENDIPTPIRSVELKKQKRRSENLRLEVYLESDDNMRPEP